MTLAQLKMNNGHTLVIFLFLMEFRNNMSSIIALNKVSTSSRPAIFIFPHAGGSPRFFHFWAKLLPDYPLFGLTYPGRDHLLQAPAPESLRTLAHQLAFEIHAHAALKTSACVLLVGHSMGAWLAYEASILLKGCSQRIITVISGQNPPNLVPHSKLHQAPDEQLIADINRQNPAARHIWEIPELRSLFLPIIRMDYRLLETYQPSGKKVRELAVIYGKDDHEICQEALPHWQQFSDYTHPDTPVDGGHFYLSAPNTQLPNLLHQLAESLTAEQDISC
ncbi:thioesterase II family protein [Suttonella indologenes]|nr:alpha/beta fold hydrolase [Suttonella indologenes]